MLEIFLTLSRYFLYLHHLLLGDGLALLLVLDHVLCLALGLHAGAALLLRHGLVLGAADLLHHVPALLLLHTAANLLLKTYKCVEISNQISLLTN